VAQIYKFFNSGVDDPRPHYASDFADYFGSVLSTGLLHTDGTPGLLVSTELGTLNTVVAPGKAIMKGYLYENTSAVTLRHNSPEPTLDRIDRIILRLDLRSTERKILLHVKEGVPNSNPVAPALQRDNFIYELSLARVRVKANTIQLLQADLTDERLQESVCGIVSSLITIPTAQFEAQWNTYYATKTAEINSIKTGFDQDKVAFKQAWDTWFAQQQVGGFLLKADIGKAGSAAKHDDLAALQTDYNATKTKVTGLREETTELRVEVRTSDPASPKVGQIWLRSDL